MTTYTIELQRPAGTLERRVTSQSRRHALDTMRQMIRACGDDGFVVVLRDGCEITYAAMRGLEV